MTADFPYRGVVVGTDGSPTAEAAVRAAAVLAAGGAVPLTIATAWHRERDDAPARSEVARYPGGSTAGHEAKWATTTASDAAAVARSLGAEDVRQRTPEGAAADGLIQLGEDRPGSLLVVGTVGLDRRTERVVGNVPHQLTHHATSDLLLVRSDRDRGDGWRTVALATDGSSTAAVACEHGHALSRSLGIAPVLLTVANSETGGQSVLERAVGQFPDGDQLTREVAVGGDVSDTLIEVAPRYDLVVLGNKGMSGPSRLLGSVSNRVTHHVPTDLLLVNSAR